MKKFIAVLLLVMLAACTTQTVVKDDGANTVTERTVVRNQEDGRVITAITGSGSQPVKVTVDNIELYSAEHGWVTVAGDEETYDLNTLPGQLRLAGNQEVDATTYTQLRLDISSADVNGVNAQVPAEKFLVPVNLVIAPGSTTVVALDIHGDASVSTAGNRVVFTPVVTVSTCVDATANVNGKIVTTTCQAPPVVKSYTVVGGQVVVTNVVREQSPIIYREVTNSNTTVYNTTVIHETTVTNNGGSANNTSTNSSMNATA